MTVRATDRVQPWRTHRPPSVVLDAIIVVARLYRVTRDVVTGEGCSRIDAETRRMVVGLVDGFDHGITIPGLGRALDRDNSTIVAMLGRHREQIARERDAAYAMTFEAARMALQALGYRWRGPSARRGLDMDRRRSGLCRRWNERYCRAARAARAA